MLPKKSVNLDDGAPVYEAMLAEGGLYQTYTPADVVKLEPRMACASCGVTATDLGDCKPQYPTPASNCVSLDPADATRMVYTLVPCGCRVSQEWAAAFTKELHARLGGAAPGPVIDMTEPQRERTRVKLESTLSTLYALQASATSGWSRDNLQCRILATVDRLMRLYPGKHNRVKPAPLDPTDATKAWAAKNHYALPPAAHAPPTPATPVQPATQQPGFKPLTPNPQKGWPTPASLDFSAKTQEGAPAIDALVHLMDTAFASAKDMLAGVSMGKAIDLDAELAAGKALAPKPGEQAAGYGPGYPMPKKPAGKPAKAPAADAKLAAAVEEANAAFAVRLRSVLASCPDDELADVFSDEAFRMPPVMLKRIIRLLDVNADLRAKLLTTAFSKQVSYNSGTSSDWGVTFAAGAVWTQVRESLCGHLSARRRLSHDASYLLAAVFRASDAASAAAGPKSSAASAPIAAAPDEAFHAGLKRKKRVIRELD